MSFYLVIDQALEETRKAAQKDLTEIEITLAKLRERIFIEKSLVLDEEYQLITSEQHPMIQQRYKELEVQLKDQLAGLEGWIELRKDYIERKHSDMVMRAETDQAVGNSKRFIRTAALTGPTRRPRKRSTVPN